MTFSERSPVLLGVITAALITVGTIVGLSLQGGILRGGYDVTVEVSDATGLHAGDPVTVAGLRAGRIRSVELAGGHADVVVQIADHDLPADTRARVVLRSLVGRRVLELVPHGPVGDLLADGDRIPVEHTRVPIDFPELADVTEELLTQSDVEALNTLLAATTDITRDQHEPLAELVDGGTRLAGIVTAREDELRELLGQLETVAGAVSDRDDELIAVLDDFGAVLAEIADRREDVRALARDTHRTAATAADLVEDRRAEIDAILHDLHRLSDIASRHQLDIAEALAYGGDAIYGFSSIAFSGELRVPWANIYTTSFGPAGIDVIGGCGGLIDRALDEVLGPDPRTCEEQGQTGPHDDATGPPLPEIPGLPLDEFPTTPAASQADDVAPPVSGALDAIAHRTLDTEVRR